MSSRTAANNAAEILEIHRATEVPNDGLLLSATYGQIGSRIYIASLRPAFTRIP